TSTTHNHTLSLHDALPIYHLYRVGDVGTTLHLGCRHPLTMQAGRKMFPIEYGPGGLRFDSPDAGEFAIVGSSISRVERIPCTERSEEHTSELQSPYDLVCR